MMPSAYARYSREPVPRTDSIDPDGAVNVDRDPSADVVGIELYQDTKYFNAS